MQVDNSNDTELEQYPFLTQSLTYLPASALQLYRSRITVAQLPVSSLALLVLGLVLFFVSMMAELLVERQMNAIAILPNRGEMPPTSVVGRKAALPAGREKPSSYFQLDKVMKSC